MRQIYYSNRSHEFYSSLLPEHFQVIIGAEIRFEILIDNSNFKCKGVIFKDCIFEEKVTFSSVDLSFGVRFINCKFKDSCIFNKATAAGIDVDFNDDNVSILFEECDEVKEVLIVSSTFDRSFTMTNCSSIYKIHIEGAHIHDIHLEKCNISDLDINYLETELGFRIEKCNVSGQGRYFGCTGDGFSFMGSTFSRDQQLWANSIKNITTNDGVFEDEFIIKSCPAVYGYTLYGTIFKKAVLITTFDAVKEETSIIPNLYLRNCDFQAGFDYKSTDDIVKRIRSCHNLSIDSSALSKGNITFENAYIDNLKLKGTNSSSSISFRGCSFEKVNIDHFTNLGNLYFSDMESLSADESEFSINRTILGNAVFLNVSFQHFEQIIIKHSQITDIVTADIKWFAHHQLNPLKSLEEGVYDDRILRFKKGVNNNKWFLAKTNKEVYRQLKYASSKQGNVVQSLLFKTEEMKAYNQELHCYKLNSKTIGNKFMMTINQSNEYGQNWIRPILILLLINIPFFIIITLGQSDKLSWRIAENGHDVQLSIKTLTNNLGAFWSLLNPVRRLSDIYDKKALFDGLTIFFDYLNRVIVSYFLFQTVSAFRKYNKQTKARLPPGSAIK